MTTDILDDLPEIKNTCDTLLDSRAPLIAMFADPSGFFGKQLLLEETNPDKARHLTFATGFHLGYVIAINRR